MKNTTMNRATVALLLIGTGLLTLSILPAVESQILSGELSADTPTQPQGGLLYIVNTTSDAVVIGACQNGNPGCSLRGAIQTANGHPGADGIVIDLPTTDPFFNGIFWTIHLGSALPDVTESISISGPGAAKLVVRRNTGGNYRIFNVTTVDPVSFTGMTIREGNLPGGNGGGIASPNNGTVHVTDCAVIANIALNGGGVYSMGTLTLTNCTLSGNSAISSSSGQDAHGGGVYFNGFAGATVTVSKCAINSNSATVPNSDGGNGYGGGFYINGTANMTNCSLGTNFARGDTDSDGGGIFFNSGAMNLTNCTLSGSDAENGGGIYARTSGTVNVTNCTLSSNTAASGGGIFKNTGSTMNIKSSIIALNSAFHPNSDDASGSFTSQGFNLIGKNDGAAASFPAGNPNANNDIVGTNALPIDPMLDPNGLQNNGGPTPTVALLPGSPAIDKGTNNASTGTLTTDQRGVGYVRIIDDPSVPNAAGGNGADVGAFELGAHIDAVSRKMHGAFIGNISLPLVGPSVGIECRTGGATNDHQVIMTFPSAVTLTSASVTTGAGSVSGSSVSGAQVTVNLTGVTNAQTITITLNNVSDGTNTGNVSVPMGVLLGDTTGSGTVNASDVSLTKLKSGQAVDGTNFRTDVTVSNSINSSDVSTVKLKSGTALP